MKKQLLLIVLFVGFSCEGMRVADRSVSQPNQKQAQAFLEVCKTMPNKELEKAKAIVSQDRTFAILITTDSQKKTLLHRAIENKWTDFALWLIEQQGCPLEGKDDQGRTPLSMAVFVGDTAVISALIKKGIAFDGIQAQKERQQPSWWNSPFRTEGILHEAIKKRAPNLVQLIEANKHIIDKPNGDGDAPLHVAVACAHEEAVNALVAAGATIALANKAKSSPLHLAAAADSAVMCAALLNKVESLAIADVKHMLEQPPRVQDAHAQEALRLISDDKNYVRYEEGLVTITNDTTWRLKLTYVLARKTGEAIILQGDKFLLYAPLADLSKLEVAVYGKKWQYLQWNPLDLYDAWRREVTGTPHYTFEVKIEGEKGWLWQYISPFRLSLHGDDFRNHVPFSRVPIDCSIARAFPCVMASLAKPKPVSARNFLQLSSTDCSSEEAIHLAHARLKAVWERERDALIAHRPYADRVIALLGFAYIQLIKQEPGMAFAFDPLEKVMHFDLQGHPAMNLSALQCLLQVFKEAKTLTPELIALFLKKFRAEEVRRLLCMRDASGKTATYVALENGHNQLFMLLHAKDAGENL